MLDFEFTEKLTPKEFEAALMEFRESLQGAIEASAGGFDTTDDGKRKRVAQLDDFLWFAREYFPHYIRDKKVRGKTVRVRPSILHEWIGTHFAQIIQDEESHNISLAAPRGEAKSTYLVSFVIWCIVRNLKHYIIYIMDVYEQAAVVVEAVAIEFEINPRLVCDFPDIVGKGKVWRQGEIVTKNGVKFQAKGAKQRVRGLKHGAFRPDLVVLDDIENDENVRSPAQRDALTDWVNSAVENLGEGGEKFDILYAGTMIHHDSTLKRTMDNPLWKDIKFQAIVRWPDNMVMWDEWEEILYNDGIEAADAFYKANKEEMERGAVVSWPDKRPLYLLMKLRVKVGHSSFDKEYQNDPVASDANFKEFVFWVKPNPRWIHFGAIDPSLGKKTKGRDPSAILIGGLDRETKTLDVIVADIKKRLPSVIIRDAIEYQKQFSCLMWFVEAVQFQEFLRTELMQAALDACVPLPAKGVIPSSDKDLRIASLEPPMEQGLIRLNPNQRTLIEQFRHWPKGDHDDGPDCLHMLWQNAVKVSRKPEIEGGHNAPYAATDTTGFMG